MKKGIGKKICDARNELDITQVELAEMIGSAHSTIANWETGRFIPEINSLKKLSEVLKKPLEYFFEETEKIKVSSPIAEYSSMNSANTIRLPALARARAHGQGDRHSAYQARGDLPHSLHAGAVCRAPGR